ncbi:MAG: aminoacyl-tRNA hydrolase [Dehalococcoidia bacterium]|nr:MAG: aminoacyl-tRNA hydrolase [Dehalococcoidia bacterium]
MKFIVGLGNPGRRYAGNRHNIGFICLNHFARYYAIRWNRKQGIAKTGSGEIVGSTVLLAKPQTYMNHSGQSVRHLVNKFKIHTGDLIVIHDDLDLPLGRIRIRCGGSSGGHKGINSIISELRSHDFVRIRFGIGRPLSENGIVLTSEGDIIDFVLSDFTPEEKCSIKFSIICVSEAITCLLEKGLKAAMNTYN